MKLSIKNIREADYPCDALILPFTEGNSGAYDDLKPSVSRFVKKLFPQDFSGKLNELLSIPAPPDIKPERILLIGLGKENVISHERVRQAGGKAIVHLRERGMKKIALSTMHLSSLNMQATEEAFSAFIHSKNIFMKKTL